MNAYTSNASLVIHPDDPNWVPETSGFLADELGDLGLIAAKLSAVPSGYLVGDSFLDLIAFMGCSPDINLVPDENADTFCFIKLIGTDTITPVTSRNTHAPHCPACSKPVRDWDDILTATSLKCSNCGEMTQPWLYNWRKTAGFGRCFIEITEIYPKEAVPQPVLLDQLETISNTGWQYFYLLS